MLKEHKTFAWLPGPINNAMPTLEAVNRKQSLFSTVQQFNKHLFLLNNHPPGPICTNSCETSTAATAVAAALQMPCPGARTGMQPTAGATFPTPQSPDPTVWNTQECGL